MCDSDSEYDLCDSDSDSDSDSDYDSKPHVSNTKTWVSMLFDNDSDSEYDSCDSDSDRVFIYLFILFIYLLVFIKKLYEDEITKEKLKQENMKMLRIIIWGLHRVISTVKKNNKYSKNIKGSGGIRTAKISKAWERSGLQFC